LVYFHLLKSFCLGGITFSIYVHFFQECKYGRKQGLGVLQDKKRLAVAFPTSKNVTVEGNYLTGGRNYPIITVKLKQANICKLFDSPCT